MSVVPFPTRRAEEDLDLGMFRAAIAAYDRHEFGESHRLVILALTPRFFEMIDRDWFDDWRVRQLAAEDEEGEDI
jgi:hypothetical protein